MSEIILQGRRIFTKKNKNNTPNDIRSLVSAVIIHGQFFYKTFTHLQITRCSSLCITVSLYFCEFFHAKRSREIFQLRWKTLFTRRDLQSRLMVFDNLTSKSLRGERVPIDWKVCLGRGKRNLYFAIERY